jgi:hypothetical protein
MSVFLTLDSETLDYLQEKANPDPDFDAGRESPPALV